MKTGIQIHLVETWYQAEYGHRKLRHTPVEHLHRLGFLGPEVSCAHSIWLTAKDMDLMAKTGAIAVTNPSSNLRLHSGVAAIHYMKEAGMNIAMGLDSTSINDDEDIFQEMRLCSVLHRVPGIGKSRLTSDEILDINQLSGAKATGFKGQTGSIEHGKKADIVLLKTERLMAPYVSSKLPTTDLVLLRAKGMDVDTVLINGDLVVEDGRFLKTDIEKLNREVSHWKETGSVADRKYSKLLRRVVSFYKRWGLRERRYRYNNFA